MGRLTTRLNEFQAFQHNYSSAGVSGASVTPGTSNSKGAWTDILGALVAEDTFGIWLSFYQMAAAGISYATLADIGIDVAGGSSYSVLIPNLGIADARPLGSDANFGFYFYFPLFIPAGSRIGCRAQQSVSVAGAFRVDVTLLQKPSHPEFVRVGSFVDAVGVDLANSRGTILTPGNFAEGAWALLGAAPRDGWFFQYSAGVDSSAKGSDNIVFDYALGDASNKRIVADDVWGGCISSDEEWALQVMPESLCYATIKAGTNLYARANTNGAESNVNAMMYVVGGG